MQLLIVLCAIAGAFAAQDCPANSHYNSCGTACPLTCENYQNPPKACVLMCVPGCHCDAGYVKAQDGSCVLPEQCGVSEAVNAVCNLPLETGPCNAYFHRYGFDKESGKCKKFVYGGCRGNGNNFETLEECENACHGSFADQPVCGENQEYKECGTACPLTCENYQNPPKICPAMCVSGCHCKSGYLKTQDGRCVSYEECPSEAVSEVCNLPLETGPCMALFHRYGFNKESGKCEKFVYGGCRGNGNNFKTLQECENACHDVELALVRPDCDKAPETGNCRAFIRRYYYDQEAGMCKKFVYGGCGGNKNNFESEFECYNKCGALHVSHASACQEEKEVGMCKAYMPRFFFNKHTGKCEEFIYGGCGGNSNNFNSLEDCEAVCY